jgi:SET and MYND domain-containing protein
LDREIDKLIFGAPAFLMAEVDATEVKKSSLGGRGRFATKDQAPGDVLLSLDRPLIAVLDRPRIADTCSWCFSWTELPVLSGAGPNQVTKVNFCVGCKKVKYCSKRCQSQAWKTGHKRYCKVFAAHDEVIPSLVEAAMQVIEGINAEDPSYRAILHLESHRDDFEKIGGERWKSISFMAHTALKLLGYDESTLERAKIAVCILMCNTFGLLAPTYDSLGLTLDPGISLINHSCSPNAVIVFDGPKLAVRSLNRIKKGEEVFISYIDSSSAFGVRQAQLRDQYFFTCACPRCTLGTSAPNEAFLKPPTEFNEQIKVIDEMLPQISSDPAWPRHILGDSVHERRLSALQYYAYSFLQSPDDANAQQDPARLRKALTICRNSGAFPISRAPLPALYQQYAVACLTHKRYNEALIAMLRLHVLIDPTVYPQAHHPARVIHGWTLATLAKAVSSDPDAPFCKALQSCGVDLSVLFLALLMDIHEQLPKSHGIQSSFGRMTEETFRVMMGPGGELDTQYAQRGVNRDQWQNILRGQIKDLWPKIKTFAEDEALAAEIDEAVAG